MQLSALLLTLLFTTTSVFSAPIAIQSTALFTRSEEALIPRDEFALDERELPFELEERNFSYKLDERDLFEPLEERSFEGYTLEERSPGGESPAFSDSSFHPDHRVVPHSHNRLPRTHNQRRSLAGKSADVLEKRSKIGNKIKNFFKKIGHGIKKAAQAVGRGIVKAAKAVGKVVVPILKTAASIILKRESSPALNGVSWKRSE